MTTLDYSPIVVLTGSDQIRAIYSQHEAEAVASSNPFRTIVTYMTVTEQNGLSSYASHI